MQTRKDNEFRASRVGKPAKFRQISHRSTPTLEQCCMRRISGVQNWISKRCSIATDRMRRIISMQNWISLRRNVAADPYEDCVQICGMLESIPRACQSTLCATIPTAIV